MLPVMEPKEPPQYFRRIDAEHNVARFYVLSLEPNLFGGTSVVRQWGRIGTSGRQMIDVFETSAGATAALVRLVSTKRKRGYVEHR